MAQYFKNIPLWVLGSLKVSRDVLIAVTAISTFTEPRAVIFLLVIRETIGGIIKYSEKDSATTRKRNGN